MELDLFSDKNNTLTKEDKIAWKVKKDFHSLCEMHFKDNKTKEDLIKNHPNILRKLNTMKYLLKI